MNGNERENDREREEVNERGQKKHIAKCVLWKTLHEKQVVLLTALDSCHVSVKSIFQRQ